MSRAPISGGGDAPIRIGCSGWQYQHWRGDFYPTNLPASRWLEHYAAHFDTVEINNSFYRLPSAETFATWQRRVPPGFLYAVKASRYLTHMKKLKEPAQPLALFFSRARSLRGHLGPVLYQLPPRWPRNLERLAAFLRLLPKARQHAIEFRDASWYVDETFELLRRHRVSLCLHDLAGSATGRLVVGPFAYVRLHGPQRYAGRYPDTELIEWAQWSAQRRAQGTPVFIYFNNDIGGHAPRDAARLREMCAGRPMGLARSRTTSAHPDAGGTLASDLLLHHELEGNIPLSRETLLDLRSGDDMAKKAAKGTMNQAAKRTLINTGTDKRFVRRSTSGKFKESDDVGKSLSRDIPKKAKAKAKRGQGDRGDR